MKYLFTTLAIGDTYLRNSITLFESLKRNTEHCDFSITTDIPFSHEFIKCDLYQGNFRSGPYKCNFFFNLKCLALKVGVSHLYDFVVYVDGDFRMHPEFQESRLFGLFNHMVDRGIDFEFERWYTISTCKSDAKIGVFCMDKLTDLGILDHSKYDDACIPNEQILVYKNGPKYRHYIQCYERWLWYCIQNGISHYAEGVEMGISALESNMNVEADAGFFTHLKKCFEFDDGRGNTFIRY